MKEFIEKLIGRLEEKENETVLKAPNTSDISNTEYQKWMMKSYGFKESIEIANELAEEYIPCTKSSCSECEVYDKEKHYCPKWCEVIKHTTNELVEEHNNGWIPVSERLPIMEEYKKNNGKFIVTDGNVVFVANFDIYETQSFGVPLINGFCTNPCIAWRPLPAPCQPKGE